jgi:hypothetical protein
MPTNRIIRYTAVLLLAAAPPLAAQIQSRPADPPLVTAANETWYQLGEPIYFSGDMYYRAGSARFFDGNLMVRSGYYNGIPLYMDATMEPYSVVLVPVRSGLMQPYERRRRGDLAGTTGSRIPSFPSQMRASSDRFSFLPFGPPTEHPLPIGAIAASELVAPVRPVPAVGPIAVQLAAPAAAPWQAASVVSLDKPESNDGVWIHYQGMKWVSAGAAVPLRADEFRAIGQYEGFPVFVRKDEDKTIYLPTRAGLVAPYKAR